MNGNHRGWPETDHGDLYGFYSLDLEKEVTQWSNQELCFGGEGVFSIEELEYLLQYT